MNNNKQKKLLGVLFVFFIVTFLVTVIFISNRNDHSYVDEPPLEGENILPDQASIFEGEDLLFRLGSLKSFNLLKADIYTFGKTAYDKYTLDENANIGFLISSEIVENTSENTLSFEGMYGASKDKISISVTTLKHHRLTVSITNKEDMLNIDEYLPSNSKTNQFIGTLPIDSVNYEIEYFSESDSFLINVFNTPDGNDEAERVIKSAVGEDVFREINIVRYGVGFGSGGANFGL